MSFKKGDRVRLTAVAKEYGIDKHWPTDENPDRLGTVMSTPQRKDMVSVKPDHHKGPKSYGSGFWELIDPALPLPITIHIPARYCFVMTINDKGVPWLSDPCESRAKQLELAAARDTASSFTDSVYLLTLGPQGWEVEEYPLTEEPGLEEGICQTTEAS